MTFETSTAPWIGMGDYVISVKRHAFDDYERKLLKSQITALESKVADLDKKIGTGGSASTATGGSVSTATGGSPAPATGVTASTAKVEAYEDDDTLALVALIVAVVGVVGSLASCVIA